MLSLFPSFLDYNIIAVAVLRMVVGVVFIAEGYKTLSKRESAGTLRQRFMSGVELLFGIFLFAGLLTQGVAIILSAISAKRAYLESSKKSGKEKHVSFYLLLFMVSLSFLFFGPGLWSIDYPL
jgi:uncharacterized membrane protein YphA (DoxX/SURF4 family)